MHRSFFVTNLLFSLLLIAGCSGVQNNQANSTDPSTRATNQEPNSVYKEDQKTPEGEPAYITVQHCLISFQGAGTDAKRPLDQAETLALELFEKAKAGEDFDELVKQHTDDSPPGIYRMANRGFAANTREAEPVYARDKMVPAFGNTGFPLQVGEYGLAVFDRKDSPYGWHIVKRIR